MKHSDERLRDFAESASDWFFEFDAQLNFSYVSERLQDIIGVAPKDLLGKPRSAFAQTNLLDSEAHLFAENTARMNAREDWKDFTFTFVKEGGDRRILRTSAKAIFDNDGDFAGYRGVGCDVTDQLRVENHANSMAQIVEDMVNEIYILDANTYQTVEANQAARENLGYSINAIRQLKPWEFVQGLDKEHFEELCEPLRSETKDRQIFEEVQLRKDGTSYPVRIQLQLMKSQTPPVFVAMVQDITEQKKQNDALKLRERAIAEVDTGILITDATQKDNPIIYANRAMEQITGYLEAEMLGRNPRFLQGKDHDQPALDSIRAAIADATPVHETLRNYRKDGSRYMSEVAISPIRTDNGNLSHFIGVQTDVTEKLETEDRLRQSQKMEAVGQLTGGIAHDFNNLLTVVIGNNELLTDRLNEDELSLSLLSDATAAAESGANLTRQLLSFSRQMPLDAKVIDLNSLVEEMSDLLDRTLGEAIVLSKKLASDLANTLTDPVQLQNALLNLALNARDAMPEGGELNLETTEVVLDADSADKKIGVNPGQYVRLSVMDNGTGMSPEIRARVMEPFFTTKEKGKGTGLGLSMVHGFAKQSGGHVDVYSEVGHGTAISLYLPVAHDSRNAELSANEHGDPKPMGGETVLIVEDDPQVRNLTVKRLQHLGYKVLEADSGQQALDILDKIAVEIDVVFTDMVMPGGLMGSDVLQQVQEKYPHIKRLITSGYAEDGVIPNNGTLWLRKPYTLQEMAKTFRQILD